MLVCECKLLQSMLTSGIFGSVKRNSCHRLFTHWSFQDWKYKVCFWVRHFPSIDWLTSNMFYRIMSLKYARCAKPPPASWQDSADIAAHFVSNAPSSKFTTCLAATLTFLPLLDNSDLSAIKVCMTALNWICFALNKGNFHLYWLILQIGCWSRG